MSDLGSESKKYYLKMKYQERQFLRARDFQDEQDYHIAKIKNHNRTLHSRGVCEGMEVKKSSKDYCVDVYPGTAIDFDGNPILLTEIETVDLRNFSTGVTNIVLTMRYGESNSPDRQHNLDEGGFTGCTRTMEKPIFEASPASSKSPGSTVDTNPNRLVLAEIVRETGGIIKTVDDSLLSGRLKAGVQYADVTSADIAEGAITTPAIRDGAVTAAKIAPNTITSFQMGNASVNTGAIQSGAVTSDKLERAGSSAKAKGAVAPENIQNGAVTTPKLADGAVTSIKLAWKSVTTDKLADNAVYANNLSHGPTTGAVATCTIQDYAVTSDKLMRGAVIEDRIKNDAVTRDKIRDGSVTTSKIGNGAVTLSKLLIDVTNADISFSAPASYFTMRFVSASEDITWKPSFFNVHVLTTGRNVTWTERMNWHEAEKRYYHQLTLRNESYIPGDTSTHSTRVIVRQISFVN